MVNTTIKHIVYSDSFMSIYTSFRGKSRVNIDHLSSVMLQDLNKKIRYLNRPYLKIKGKLLFKSLRILAVYDHNTGTLLPLFITDKNNKLYGDNMIWETISVKIKTLYDKILDDVETGKYITYDIG